MGLILRPAEIKNCAKQVKSSIEGNQKSYEGALQVVKNFAGNEAFQSKSWDTAKGKIVESHQLIVRGIMAAQDSVVSELDTASKTLDGPDRNEDELIQDILRLEEECKRYMEMIKTFSTLQSRPVIGNWNISRIISHYQEMLEITKKELELVKEELNMLYNQTEQTSSLFQTIDGLFQAVEYAINDAEVYISGRGELSDGTWKVTIPKTIVSIQKNELDSVLKEELGIDLKDFENLYKEEANKVLDYMVQNNIYKIDENETQAIVVTILENLSGCSVTIQNDAYQFQLEDSTIIHEFTEEKIKEKIKLGTENENWKITGVTIPETVTGIINGEEKKFFPLEQWGAPGKGNYKAGVQKNEEGRYLIAVAPKILDANYPDEGKLQGDEFIYGKIDLILENNNTGEEEIIKCQVGDIKAHTYNQYPCETGDITSFSVESGLVQTGIAYPNSWNAGHDPYAEYTINCSVIEFMGHKVDFKIADYTLKSIVVIEE